MKTAVLWKDGMSFNGVAGQHIVPMDAKQPLGKDGAPSPKELVAIGLGGCTAMDVVALLRKYKQQPLSLRVDVDVVTTSDGHPMVFEKALLSFFVDGQVDSAKLLEAVKLSQTKFCGVSAMLSRAFSIEYRVFLNKEEIGRGFANFNSNDV